ncbi:hypothetical protein M2189_002382 [Bradyrhizobium japonicum]|uniref:hypothetical protein n=1 Tax=Bradyrhizobium japonicum TaxID=375 RepID=UPI0021679DC3|nr:hypothetical protein [Bradyrhizobium japonicum]MCS3498659.1 hypothetical protein [Bradyrhizobium japonicum]MCS3959179.1 hypothetical protein [Bradyrhizobium japonicum]MCS4000934.1 hypothetical protein [Bradyrhizobium japonicum]
MANSVAVLRCIAACIENGCIAIALLNHATPDHPEGERVFSDNWELLCRFQKHVAAVTGGKQARLIAETQ